MIEKEDFGIRAAMPYLYIIIFNEIRFNEFL